MSLVQSIFNQVGREIGRDLYKSAKSLKSGNSYSEYDELGSILKEIQDFQLSSYDKTTIKKLANLVERSGEISSRNFIFDDIFIELDRKIDFAKKYVKEEHKDTLEQLDKENNFNYTSHLYAHKLWIGRQVEEKEKKVSELKDVTLVDLPLFLIKGFWFVSFSILFAVLIYNSFTYWKLLSLFCWLPSFLFRVAKFSEINTFNKSERDSLKELKDYYSSLNVESLN
jgi:hypothetical protein